MLHKHQGALLLTAFFILNFFLFQSVRLSGDGLAYYAYTRSVLFDGDMDFSNEFRDYNPLDHATPDLENRTITGLIANPFAVGAAILRAPFVLIAHAGSHLFMEPALLTGYELQYIAAGTLATNFYALLGILTIYHLSSSFFGSAIALRATLAVWLGTAMVNYLYFDPFYAHLIGAAMVALFIASSICYRRDRNWAHLIATALAGGFMVLTRWQNALFFLVLVLPVVVSLWQTFQAHEYKQFGRLVLQMLICGVIVGCIFVPQVIVWNELYGVWMTVPMGDEYISWSSPVLIDILISPHNGLLTWTPLIGLCLIGLFVIYRYDKYLTLSLMLVFLAQMWLNASVWDWWGGSSFGSRRFIDSSVLFALGLAGLLHACRHQRTISTALDILLVGIVFWNLGLWTQYAIGSPPVQSLKSVTAIYGGNFIYGFPQIYRLLGRSTWLDLLLRSGILANNWSNVGIALVLMFVFLVMTLIVLLFYIRLVSLSSCLIPDTSSS